MYYFIGIKGAGMSALAEVLFDLGYEVMGSDLEDYFFTEDGLRERNIKILPFDEKNIKEDMIIVKGNAYGEDNVEVAKAMAMGLTIHTYQDMLAKLTNMFEAITVAGTHGKTLTASMLAHVLDNLNGTNYLIGDGSGKGNKEDKYFVLEADEYQRHFLEYNPYYAIITNIDYDHLDYFKDIDDVIDAYQKYASNALKMVIACGDDPYTHSLEISKPIFFYGTDDDNDIIAKDVIYSKDGVTFDVFVEDNYYGHFDLPLYGKHNLLNALAVISVCYYERLEAKEVAKLLKTFSGAKRRFTETVIEDNVIIDDCANHPAEIKATIKAVKQKYEDKDIITILKPRTYLRLNEFLDEYIEIFKGVKKAYIMDINDESNGNDIIKKVPKAEAISPLETDKLLKYKNSVLLFMGPNDIKSLENDYIMKKTKNGFSLIELLVVIAILGIVALITIPIITGVISTAEKNAFKDSVDELVHITELDYAEFSRAGTIEYYLSDNKITCDRCAAIDYNGEIDKGKGTITIINGVAKSIKIENDEYKASLDSKGKVVITVKE